MLNHQEAAAIAQLQMYMMFLVPVQEMTAKQALIGPVQEILPIQRQAESQTPTIIPTGHPPLQELMTSQVEPLQGLRFLIIQAGIAIEVLQAATTEAAPGVVLQEVVPAQAGHLLPVAVDQAAVAADHLPDQAEDRGNFEIYCKKEIVKSGWINF